MKNRLTRIMALLRIEIGVSYRYPIIEGLVLLIFLLPLLTMLSFSIDIRFSIDEFDKFTYAVDGFSKLHLISGLEIWGFLWVLIIPFLTAFSIAKSFEDGHVQTLLTYPITRVKLLAIKITLVIMIPVATFTVMILFASLVAIPEFPQLIDLMTVLIGCWISFLFYASLSALIATISRKMSTTAIIGLAYPYIASLLNNDSTVPGLLRVVFNPFRAVTRFLNSSARGIIYDDIIYTITLLDIQYGLTILLIISLILIAVNLWIFKRSQI